MSESNCYRCGRPFPEQADANAINDGVRWYDVYTRDTGYRFGVFGERLDRERFELISKNTHAEESQGDTWDVWLAFKDLTTGKFYKKLGRGDSYGEIEWDGAVFEVKAVAKTVTVYEVQ